MMQWSVPQHKEHYALVTCKIIHKLLSEIALGMNES